MSQHSSNCSNCRTLSNGQRGEIYEINGDQVAVIFDPPDEKLADGKKDEANEDCEEQDAKSSVYWVDSMYSIPSTHNPV
jgi:DNA-binding helix-hairpin-helix protein with protein kinase domain